MGFDWFWYILWCGENEIGLEDFCGLFNVVRDVGEKGF